LADSQSVTHLRDVGASYLMVVNAPFTVSQEFSADFSNGADLLPKWFQVGVIQRHQPFSFFR
jgi:hypothetical protein